MKTQMKAIVASVVVIALCFAAVGGVTYSWFSDSDQSDINVTAGNIVLSTDPKEVKIQSHGGSTKDLEANTPTTTDLGGTAEYSKTVSESTTILSITVNNMVPGDIVTFKITPTLFSTIRVAYVESSEVQISGTPITSHPFIINGLNNESKYFGPTGTVDDPTKLLGNDNPTKTISIKMDENAGSSEMGRNYTINIKFEAYQANAPVSDSVSGTIVANNTNTLSVFPTSETVSSASISFTGTNAMEDELISVSAIDTAESTYRLSNGSSPLAGIKVDTDATFTGTSVTISFVIPGNVSVNTITIYHETEEIWNGTSASDGVGNPTRTYDDTSNTTTITFTTTLGFSDYTIYSNHVAVVNGSYYSDFEEAMNNAGNGTVYLLKDITITANHVPIDVFAGNIDGQNHTITLSEEYDKGEYSIFKCAANGSNIVLKNFKYEMLTTIPYAICYGWGSYDSSITFENVDICARTYEAGYNHSAYIKYSMSDLKFIDCDNYASYYCYAYDSYNGIFVGGFMSEGHTAEFIRCTNHGDMLMTNPGMFFGNLQNNPTIYIQDCVNYGQIQAIDSNATILGSKFQSGMNGPTEQQLEQLSSGFRGNDISYLSDDNLSITQDSSGITVTTTNISEEYSYKIWYSCWASCYKDGTYIGTHLTRVGLDVDPGLNSDIFKCTKIQDSDTYTGSLEGVQFEPVNNAYGYCIIGNTLVIDFNNDKISINATNPDTITINKAVTKICLFEYENGIVIAGATL